MLLSFFYKHKNINRIWLSFVFFKLNHMWFKYHTCILSTLILIITYEFNSLIVVFDDRCSPGALLSVIQGFNEVQKDCVEDMGFGDLLKMKMTEVPGALSCFVLEKFDSTTKKIILQRGKIDVTRESVHQILGFPLGRKKFSELPLRTIEDNTYEEWTQQFENKSMIRLQEIKMKIVSSNKADMNFKMNFLALLINSLIESSSSGKANTSPLKYIMEDTKISNIDWCSYLIDCLVKTKQSYDPSSSTSNFVGPSAYLVVCLITHLLLIIYY